MKYRVQHSTHYSYSAPVTISHNLLRIVPRSGPRQQCLIHRLEVTPTPHSVRSWTDFFGNAAAFFVIEHPHREVEIAARSIVEVDMPQWPEPQDTPAWETIRDGIARGKDPDALSAAAFAFESPHVRWDAAVSAYVAQSFSPGRPLLAAALELSERIHDEFQYDPNATVISTATPEVLHLRRGVCQDFAHLQLACLRSLGLAARYISGYLLTDPPPGQPKLIGADASHAWLAIWCPGHGWVELDPTNRCLAGARHVTLGWGRDYGDISPVRGVVLGGGTHTLNVSVDVAQCDDADTA